MERHSRAIEQRPELRIVSDESWRAVRERMGTPRVAGGRSGRGGIPTTLLGGLLRCGHCEGSLVKIDAHSYGCAAHKDRGNAVCGGLRAPRAVVDCTLINHLYRELNSPATLALIEAQATGMRKERIRQSSGDRQDQERRRIELEREVTHLVDAVASIGMSPALTIRLRAAENELAALQRHASTADIEVLSASIGKRVRALGENLERALFRSRN